MIITLLSRPARWWNPFKFPLLCSRVPLPQSPNPNFIQLLPQILHRSKTSNMIFAVFAFPSIWHIQCVPKKSCSQNYEGCAGKANLWTKVVQCGQKLSNYGHAVQDNLDGPKIWYPNIAIKILFFGTPSITSELFVFFSLLSTGGREWAPSSMKAPLLGTECSARRLPAIDFYFHYSYY